MEDIKLTEEQKQEVYNFLKDDIISDERIQPYLQIARIVGSENSDDSYTDTSIKGLLTYYKYELYNAIMKDPKNSLKEITLGLIKNDYPILMFNIDEWLYENMELIENEDAIKELVKTFYLIHKYKGTLFSDDVLQYFKDIEDIVNVEKPQIKEDTKDPLEMSKLNKWYQIQLYNLLIPDIFRKYLKGFPYNENEIKERAIRCFKDNDFRLSLYYILFQAGETKEKIIDFIYNSFTNCISHSDTLYKFRSYLNLHVLDMSKKHNIDISLTYGEQEKIDKKIQDIKEFIYSLDTQKYKYGDLMDNFFKISDIYNYLSFDENKEKAQNSDKNSSKKAQKKPCINKANKEELEKVTKKKNKNNYLTNSTPTNRAILDTYGAYAGIETSNIEKILLKIKEVESNLKQAKTTEKKADLKSELELLKKKKESLEQTQKELANELIEAKDSLREAKREYDEKEQEHILSSDDKKAYNNLIFTLSNNVIEKESELKDFNSKGLSFRGNLFNELEYTDDRGKTIASLRNQNGEILEAKDIPTLAEAFLRLTNDHYYNRLDNYNTFYDKIDVLFPKTKGTTYRIANETIKRNLGKNGYIIDLKELIKILHVSDNNLRHYSDNIQETIRFFNNIQISVQQQDKLTKNDDVLNMFFGITNNVYASRQVNGNIYIYYEISSVYETILDNSQNPIVAQNPIVLLKYATGQQGNKRIFKLGDYLFNDLRRSLNSGVSGIKLNNKGQYYKRYKVKTLLRPLRESRLITETKARKGKYRDDVFYKFIKALDQLEKEYLIKYNLYFDDDVKLSSDVFKTTFENTFIDITFTYSIEEYENILSKNIENKKKAHITNAGKYILPFGKYQGKTIKEVYDVDKQYLEYVLNTPDLKITKPKVTRQHIKNYLQHKKNLEELKEK